MKNYLMIGVISVLLLGCSTSSDEQPAVIHTADVSPDLTNQLTAAQELERDIEQLNHEIDSLLNLF